MKLDKQERILLFLFLGFMSFGLVMAMVIPENILTYGWAKEFSIIMAKIFPHAEKLGRISIMPGVAQFFASIMWLFAIPLFFAICYAIFQNKNHIVTELQGNRGKILIIFISGIILVWGAYADYGSGTGRIAQTEASSRFGLGLLGTLNIFAAAFFSACLLALIKYLPIIWRRNQLNK